MKMNKKAAALGGLAAVAVVGGTWAYFNQTAAITNPFSTGSYGGSIVESFNPSEGETWAYFNQTAAITNPFSTGSYGGSIVESFNPSEGDNWQPGATVDKEVVAENTGNSPLLVRVKMAETWSRNGMAGTMPNITSADGDAFATVDKEVVAENTGNSPLLVRVKMAETWSRNGMAGTMPNITSADGDAFLNVSQADPKDGETATDDTVVHKNLADNDAWEKADDGYWYYRGQLAPGATTESLLESVTLDKETDMGLYATTYKYCTTPGKDSKPGDNTEWKVAENGEEDADMLVAAEAAKEEGNSFHVKKETALDEAHPGYADADYELEITIDMVQPTEDAVVDAWGEDALNHLVSFAEAE